MKKKLKYFPLKEKIKRKFTLFLAKTKSIPSHGLKISAILLVLCTCEITDIFSTFDEIYLVFN